MKNLINLNKESEYWENVSIKMIFVMFIDLLAMSSQVVPKFMANLLPTPALSELMLKIDAVVPRFGDTIVYGLFIFEIMLACLAMAAFIMSLIAQYTENTDLSLQPTIPA